MANFVIIIFCLLAELANCENLKAKTLVVSFNGFSQQNFVKRAFLLPWFDHFRKNGVFTESIRSVFPTESFPNHFSIATGLYPESHGIVGNFMYDPKTGRHFARNNSDPLWWRHGEPIWITASRFNVTKSVVSAWPGGDVPYYDESITADYIIPFDAMIPFRKRVDQIVELMAEKEVGLGFLYHFQPDYTGHIKGINGPVFANEIMRNDWLLSYVILATERAGLTIDNLNLIICSDHGIVDIERYVYLEDFINVASKIHTFSRSGAFAAVWPKTGQVDAVYLTLKKAADRSGGVWNVFRRSRLPERFHYKSNERISPILVTGSLGTYVGLTRAEKVNQIGIHGYDPEFVEMRPIFMARGPAFKSNGYNASRFEDKIAAGVPMETKDIYALVAKLIGLPAGLQPPNNASIGHFLGMFTRREEENEDEDLVMLPTEQTPNNSVSKAKQFCSHLKIEMITFVIILTNHFHHR